MQRLILLFLCAAGACASSQPAVRRVEVPAGYSSLQPAGLHASRGAIVLTGTAASADGRRSVLVSLSEQYKYLSHREVAGSGSELLVETAEHGAGFYLLSNQRGTGGDAGGALQSMKLTSVTPAGEPAWSSTLGGQGFTNAGGLSYDAGSGTLAALGWNDAGGWDLLVALFESDGRQRWLTRLGGGQDEFDGRVRVTPEIVHLYYNSWNPKGGWDILLARLDARTGAVKLGRRLPGRGSDAVADFLLQPDGGYRLLCTTTSEGGPWGLSRGKTDIALLEVSRRGRILSCSRFGWEGSEYAHRLLELGGGRWGIVGVTDTLADQAGKRQGGFDLLLLTVDAAGKLLNTQRAGTLEDDWPVAVLADAGRLDVLAATRPAEGPGAPFVARFSR